MSAQSVLRAVGAALSAIKESEAAGAIVSAAADLLRGREDREVLHLLEQLHATPARVVSMAVVGIAVEDAVRRKYGPSMAAKLVHMVEAAVLEVPPATLLQGLAAMRVAAQEAAKEAPDAG